MHPIELSVVTAAALPLAVHFARYSETRARRQQAAIAALLIGLAMPLAISRSGLVSLAVALAILFAGWDWRSRVNGLLVFLASIPLLWAFIPGLVGTLVDLFAYASDDSSVQVRLERIPRVLEHVRARPLLGLGNGTWSVDDYFLLDNQFYFTILEMGILGFLLVAGVLLLAVLIALAARGLPTADPRTRDLALAVGAGLAALSISIATFDSFFYRILTGMLFLLVGSAGALWRLHGGSEILATLLRGGRTGDAKAAPPARRRPRQRQLRQGVGVRR
jgi:O-antigen ligase